MSSKGGARHKPAPVVDEDILMTIFEKHRDVISNFGTYESVSRTQAVRGKGLLHCFALLDDLLEACPSADCPAPSAKQAMHKLAMNHPTVNGTVYNCNVWASLRCERLGTVLNHLRRLRREPARMKQCCLALTGAQIGQLKELLGKVFLEPDVEVAAGLANYRAKSAAAAGEVEAEGADAEDRCPSVPSVPGAEDDPEDPQPLGQQPKRRILQKTPSTVSCDSDGWPRVLAGSPEQKKQKFDMSPAAALVEVDSEGYPVLLEQNFDKEGDGPEVKPATKVALKGKSKASVASGTAAKAQAKSKAKSGPNQQTPAASQHKLEKYYTTSTVGIRVKGGKQLFSLRFVNKAGSYDDLVVIALEACEKLDSGSSCDEVKQWASEHL